jgi:hypothetical protein
MQQAAAVLGITPPAHHHACLLCPACTSEKPQILYVACQKHLGKPVQAAVQVKSAHSHQYMNGL